MQTESIDAINDWCCDQIFIWFSSSVYARLCLFLSSSCFLHLNVFIKCGDTDKKGEKNMLFGRTVCL